MPSHRIFKALSAMALLGLAACSPLQLGSRTLDFSNFGGNRFDNGPTNSGGMTAPTMPTSADQRFGRGPVQVALLLPLSGDQATASVGQSLANASRLAIQFVEANPNIAENITITLRDTGTSVQGATAAASSAVSEGAKLILGPLRADQVTAAGSVARSAGVPLVGFSNNPVAAGPGVYLLSVLPEMEMKRSFGWLKAQGRRGIAGIFPATEFGQAQETAFRQQAIAAGFSPNAVYTFSAPNEAQQIITQAMPQIQRGMIDTLFLPDRATAPGFGAVLTQAGVTNEMVQVMGSADWEGDPAIANAPGLAGAVYPAVDPAGMMAISADYQRQFGGQPHALATIAYTATILANVNTLSMANPPYNPMLMTSTQGFNGRDGAFRFQGNGKADYALVLKKIAPGGSQMIEGAKL
ncbi:MAG: penicillin-binding protein activator [Candidatus Devosia phytovorans]|uniref:Penicillin-binding protein activator n=1 Tax=Candidatus Devosia phytovorans TaxID=3121372 RepID=A0AAJ6B0F0_9HYPH|nr:penicillin-binding protein activator [Devosia sp.]WEK04149.1 MAG: penicillin-binding protein activator [Devosia sp.]